MSYNWAATLSCPSRPAELDSVEATLRGLGANITQWSEPVIPPEPPPVVVNRNCTFGTHYVVDGGHNGYGDQLQRLADMGHPAGAIFSMFDKGALGQAFDISGGKTCTVFRASIDDNDFPPTEQGSWYWPNSAACHQSAYDWMLRCDELWRGDNRSKIKRFAPINEPNPTDEKLDWFIQWSRYCIDIAETMGYSLAWGGFSTGTPTEYQMIYMLPFVAELMERGHILSVHDGAVADPFTFQGTATNPYAQQANSSLRYRWWQARAVEAGFLFPDDSVVISECYAYGDKNPAFYNDWKWYLIELAKDTCITGAAWYTIGDGGDFGNIQGDPLRFVVDKCVEIENEIGWDNIQ